MKKPTNILKREYFSRIYHVLDTWHSFLHLCVGDSDHFLAGCGLVWVFVTFIWLGVGGYDHFLAGCGWVWLSVTFFGCVCEGVGECDLFLAGCEWMWGVFDLLLAGGGSVWVSVTFFWLGVGKNGLVWVGLGRCG